MFQYHEQLCKDIGMPHRRKLEREQIETVAYDARDYEQYFKRVEIPQPKVSYKNPNHVP